MAIGITIPRLGWNMDEGTFVGWLKQDGDAIRAGDRLFTLEGEKATEDVECLDSGILRIAADAPQPGDKVTVGQTIGHLVKQGESVPTAKRNAQPTAATAPVPQPAAVPNRELRPLAISPRARRVARELGIDWQHVKGSGRSGRIRESDIREAAAGTRPSAPSTPFPVTPIRRIIAERMLTSARSTAPVTLTTTTDATNLVNLRNQFKAVAEGVPSYTDFIVKLAAVALTQHPRLNAQWTEQGIAVSPSIHIGVAVDTEAGLLVPVIRNAEKSTLRQIATQARDLAERARLGKLKAEEMRDGTFTITNLGSYGIDAFTPIINHPQCAILGVGRIQRLPVVVGDEIVPREQITLSLTFDHRIVDGAPAARFLQTLCRLINNPGPVLMT
jgi:pyruvate dehydrogenase E2 component (dihydrolipoamide acetyltransferase)